MPEPSDTLLSVRGLKAWYGDFQALYGVDLSVRAGEVLAVIGANGAGKSTLPKTIVGLLPAPAETVRFDGQAIGGRKAHDIVAMGVAMVPEGRRLFPSLTVEENLLIGGRVQRPGPWTLQRIYDLFPVLAERRRHASTQLSGGQQQMVAIGQQAYVGLGGYLFFALTAKAGWPPLPTLLVAGLVAAVVAVPAAALLFRLRGAYFAIGSWVLAEVLRLSANLISPLGGGSGMSLPVSVAKAIGSDTQQRYITVYCTTLAALLPILLLIALVLRSRWGLALTAIRDNEVAARSNGIDVGRSKLVVYVLTAFGTATIGALIFLQRLRISPDTAFSVNDWTALVIFMVVIGGLGSFEGPIIGTLVYFALRETLADLGSTYLMLLGAVAIVTMLWAPLGLWGLVRRRWKWQLLPLQLQVSVAAPTRGSPAKTETELETAP